MSQSILCDEEISEFTPLMDAHVGVSPVADQMADKTSRRRKLPTENTEVSSLRCWLLRHDLRIRSDGCLF